MTRIWILLVFGILTGCWANEGMNSATTLPTSTESTTKPSTSSKAGCPGKANKTSSGNPPEPTQSIDNQMEKVLNKLEESNANEGEDVITVWTTTTIPCAADVAKTIPTVSAAEKAVVNFEDVKKIEHSKSLMTLISEMVRMQTMVSEQVVSSVTQETVNVQQQMQQLKYQQEQQIRYQQEIQIQQQQEMMSIIQQQQSRVVQSIMNTREIRNMQEINTIMTQAFQSLIYSEEYRSVRTFLERTAKELIQSSEVIKSIFERIQANSQIYNSQAGQSQVLTTVKQLLEKMSKQSQQLTQQSEQTQQQQQQQTQQINEQVQQQQQQEQTVVQKTETFIQESRSEQVAMMEQLVQSLSQGANATYCAPLTLLRNQHYSLIEAMEALMKPPNQRNSTLDYRVLVQRALNSLYQRVCVREHYWAYREDLERWQAAGGWSRGIPPPLPPAKLCPPAKLFSFAKESPPWLTRLPAYIRAKYYGDTSIPDHMVYLNGVQENCRWLERLWRQGRISSTEYAYYTALRRAQDRMLLTGPRLEDGSTMSPLAEMIKLLAAYDGNRLEQLEKQYQASANVLEPKTL